MNLVCDSAYLREVLEWLIEQPNLWPRETEKGLQQYIYAALRDANTGLEYLKHIADQDARIRELEEEVARLSHLGPQPKVRE